MREALQYNLPWNFLLFQQGASFVLMIKLIELNLFECHQGRPSFMRKEHIFFKATCRPPLVAYEVCNHLQFEISFQCAINLQNTYQ